MQYGENIIKVVDAGIESEETTKYRHGLPFIEEMIMKERVEVMRPSDLDGIIEGMHIEHAFDDIYGAWLEKTKGGRLYVIKYSVKTRTGK